MCTRVCIGRRDGGKRIQKKQQSPRRTSVLSFLPFSSLFLCGGCPSSGPHPALSSVESIFVFRRPIYKKHTLPCLPSVHAIFIRGPRKVFWGGLPASPPRPSPYLLALFFVFVSLPIIIICPFTHYGGVSSKRERIPLSPSPARSAQPSARRLTRLELTVL